MNKTTGGSGGRNEGGGGRGKSNRKDLHPSLPWYQVARDDAYAIYNSLDLCFPDTKTKRARQIQQ